MAMMAVPVVAEAVSKPGTQSFLMKLILMPMVIIGTILIIAAFIAIANGAYTMGTLITFVIGSGLLGGWYFMTKAPSEPQQGYLPPGYPPFGYQPQPPGYGYPPGYPPQQRYGSLRSRPSAPPQPQSPGRVVSRPVNPNSQYATARAQLEQKGLYEGEGEEFVSDEVDVKKDTESEELIE
jgi:hypothetical protein